MTKFMRIIVMFDLPVNSKKHKDQYIRFRRFLLKDGYDMLQYSVYSRICAGLDAANKHIKRLEVHAPRKGAVRAFLITNKQFADAFVLTGPVRIQEKKVNEAQLLLF